MPALHPIPSHPTLLVINGGCNSGIECATVKARAGVQLA